MMRLYLYEMRKFFHSWSHVLLTIMLLLFPIINMMFIQMINRTDHMSYEGRMITQQERADIADSIRKQHRGIINEAWLDDMASQLHTYQNEGMKEWDVRYVTISDAYWTGFHAFTKKTGLLADDQTPQIVKKDLVKYKLRFGEQEGWIAKFSVFQNTAMAYLFILIYFFCNMFNQEDATEVMDILKSSKFGRSKLVIAKLATALSITIVLAILLYGIVHIVACRMLSLTGSDTTALIGNAFQIYSFAQLDIQAFLLLLIGGSAICVISVLFSTLTKKPMISLGMGAACYVLPAICINSFSWNWLGVLSPSMFLKFDGIGQLLQTSWVFLGDTVFHRVPITAFVWCILILCMILMIYFLHSYGDLNTLRKRGLS